MLYILTYLSASQAELLSSDVSIVSFLTYFGPNWKALLIWVCLSVCRAWREGGKEATGHPLEHVQRACPSWALSRLASFPSFAQSTVHTVCPSFFIPLESFSYPSASLVCEHIVKTLHKVNVIVHMFESKVVRAVLDGEVRQIHRVQHPVSRRGSQICTTSCSWTTIAISITPSNLFSYQRLSSEAVALYLMVVFILATTRSTKRKSQVLLPNKCRF